MTLSKDDILEKAYLLGRKYEKKCTGCAQTAIAAIFESLEIWNEDVFRSASGLADGLGLTGDGSCGALVGGSMVIGYLYGRGKDNFEDMNRPMKSYALVKKLHDKYVNQYGTCRCHDVQKKLVGRSYDLWNAEELKEAFKAGVMEHCSNLVGNVARLTTKIILNSGYKIK
jgi:C_GCAxxG_C_C family probable redox protein